MTITFQEHLLYSYAQDNNSEIKEVSTFVSNAKINDMYIDSIQGQPIFNPILACQDKTVKVLSGVDVLYKQDTNSPVLSIEQYTKVP